ncbi:MAG TPA: hypothetical protein VFQ88_01420 [Nevskiaceae bacterium]|nr:hypothetical protein [Nevskiaceae bacterium]
MAKPHVRIFVDDQAEPVIDHELPTALDLDTRTLSDGEHRLIVRAEDQSGTEGVEEIPFTVQNGPGIMVSGLKPKSTRRGTLHLKVDAFSTDDPFDARRAEARSPIPTWLWALSLFVVAFGVWYFASFWNAPPKFADTPTYAPPAAAAPTSDPGTPAKH